MISAVVIIFPLSLVDRLQLCAKLWAEASNGSPARLGRLVVNDSGFFSRLESAGASTTTSTLERFAGFLGDAANWPDGAVPVSVVEFVEAVGVKPVGAPPSPDNRGADIGTRTPEPASPNPATAASGRAPGPVLTLTGPGDLLSKMDEERAA